MSSQQSRNAFAAPTHEDQYEFLLRLYFGTDPDALSACVRRAYRDLNRTLHGVARLPDTVELGKRATARVRAAMAELSSLKSADQEVFDAWHLDACTNLCALYAESSFPSFRVGQAQKWLNMAFKYVHAFGEKRLLGFERLYRFGHVPLDNVMLGALRPYGAPRLSGAWSRIQDYSEYMHLQHWIRHHFPACAPLAVEFHLWLTAES